MQGLREALPYVTFIATSHDPLCLRGMKRGEVMVLQRVPRAEGAEVPPGEADRQSRLGLVMSPGFGKIPQLELQLSARTTSQCISWLQVDGAIGPLHSGLVIAAPQIMQRNE